LVAKILGEEVGWSGVGMTEWEMRMRLVRSRARRQFGGEKCGTTDVRVEGREWDIDMNTAQSAR